MLPLEVRKYLFDVAQACALLTQFTNGKTFADYLASPLLRSAAERQFEVIGEALNQALRVEPGLSRRVSNTHRIIAFRNRRASLSRDGEIEGRIMVPSQRDRIDEWWNPEFPSPDSTRRALVRKSREESLRTKLGKSVRASSRSQYGRAGGGVKGLR